MKSELLKEYIAQHEKKVVTSLDLNFNKIKYEGIKQCRNIDVITGEEELCRAYLLTKLVNELGYEADCIEIEHEYTAGRPERKEKKARIDIIVRDADRNAFLFIEVKNQYEYESKDKDETIREQLYKLAFLEKASGHSVKYLVLYTVNDSNDKLSDNCIIIDMEVYHDFSEWEHDRNYTCDIPAHYGKAKVIPFIKDSGKDLEKNFSEEKLIKLQNELHDVLWGGGGTDDNEVFSSLTNLILAKIQDEDTTESGEEYKFQIQAYETENGQEEFETNEHLFKRINNLYREALKSKLYILDEQVLEKSYVVDSNKFALSKLKYAVKKLEGLSFVDGKNSLSGKDILGDFFEGMIRNGFKQSKGQFFTHINIVRFMLWAIQADKLAISRIRKDKELPYMIDPSAGSGTFLIEYMKFITENMKYRFRKELGSARAVKDKIESDWFYPDNRENKWAQTYIYATESNFNLGTATKVNMILHGDGSTNIFVKDGLLPFSSYEKETAPNALHDGVADALYEDKEVNGNFDLCLTNPPFSVELDNDTKKTIKSSFIFGDKKNSENLFIERWYQLLKENGRLAAVLPESVFDITDNRYIRIFLFKYFKIKAVVSLPQLAFDPFTSTKTSILFAQKKTSKEVQAWNNEWLKCSNEYGKLKRRVENLIAVHDGIKNDKDLRSIRDMSENDRREAILRMLGDKADNIDTTSSVDNIIDRHREDLLDLCTIDKDAVKYAFGHVNLWWVFKEVSRKFENEIFFAEVENIGYKRTKRGTKEMPNELFEIEFAPQEIDSAKIYADVNDTIRHIDDLICDKDSKMAKTSNKEIEKRLSQEKSRLVEAKKAAEKSLEAIHAFIDKYYWNDELRAEFAERTDKELVETFRNGMLRRYRSEAVVLHENIFNTVLDYMRKIEWD